MERLMLSDGEYRIMDVIWNNAPVGSGDLVKLCETELNWKKSTTYTMLRKMVEKGLVRNDDCMISVLIPRSSVQRFESNRLVERSFGGSLSAFVSAFLGSGTVSKKDADELISLIESHLEG